MNGVCAHILENFSSASSYALFLLLFIFRKKFPFGAFTNEMQKKNLVRKFLLIKFMHIWKLYIYAYWICDEKHFWQSL